MKPYYQRPRAIELQFPRIQYKCFTRRICHRKRNTEGSILFKRKLHRVWFFTNYNQIKIYKNQNEYYKTMKPHKTQLRFLKWSFYFEKNIIPTLNGNNLVQTLKSQPLHSISHMDDKFNLYIQLLRKMLPTPFCYINFAFDLVISSFDYTILIPQLFTVLHLH